MTTDAPSSVTAVPQLRSLWEFWLAHNDVRNAYDLEHDGRSEEFFNALYGVKTRTLAACKVTFDALVAKLPPAGFESGATSKASADRLSEALPGIGVSRLFHHQIRGAYHAYPHEAYSRICASFIRNATRIKAIIGPVDPEKLDDDLFAKALTEYFAAKRAAKRAPKPAAPTVRPANSQNATGYARYRAASQRAETAAATPAPKPASLAASASSATSSAAGTKTQVTGLARTIAAFQRQIDAAGKK